MSLKIELDPITTNAMGIKVPPKTFDLDEYEIRVTDNYPDPPPVIHIDGAAFAYQGDISFISGQSKSGKSHVATNIIAATFKDPNHLSLDTLQITSVPHRGKKVFYIDTEQDKGKTNKAQKMVLRKLGIDKAPDNLKYYNIREISKPSDRFEAFKTKIEKTAPGEVLYWLIDGIADFVESINNEEECNAVISYLMTKCSEKNTTIICNLHLNPGTDKLRGHMGSEAERKCAGMIVVRKDIQQKCHYIESKFSRDAGNFNAVPFIWDDEAGYFVSATSDFMEGLKESNKEKKTEAKNTQIKKAINQAFATSKSLTKAQMITGFMNYLPSASGKKMVDRTAREKLKECITLGFLNYDESKDSVTKNY